MDGTFSGIDIFIGLSCLIPFAMGIAGRGVLRLSLFLAAGALSLAAAFAFSGGLVSAGVFESPAAAGAAAFAGAFVLIYAGLRALGGLPGAGAVLRTADGLAGALLGTAAAVAVIAAAGRWSDGIRAEESVLYSKAEELLRRGSGGKDAAEDFAESVEIPEIFRR